VSWRRLFYTNAASCLRFHALHRVSSVAVVCVPLAFDADGYSRRKTRFCAADANDCRLIAASASCELV